MERSDGQRLTIEGDSYRIDVPSAGGPQLFDTIISRDRDVTALYLNHQNQTWYERTGTCN